MKHFLFISCLALLTLSLHAQSFEFEREGLAVPHWGIELHGDGTGDYWEGASLATAGKSIWPITVGEPTRLKIAAAKPRVEAGNCETKAKHIANTGKKTLRFEDHSCVFNYSDDPTLMETLNAFQAIAETIQTGARLAHKHRFDRLGLDAEMISLGNFVKDGRAIELQNIAPVLRSIAKDGEVLERVRTRASQWLAQMPAAEKRN
jgi:hypothetical protein